MVERFRTVSRRRNRLVTSQNAVGVVLEVVVESGGERVDARLDHLVHRQLQLLLGQVHVEAITKLTNRRHSLVETRQVRTWRKQHKSFQVCTVTSEWFSRKMFLTSLHDFDQWHQSVHVFASGNQTLQHEYLVILKHVTTVASHHLKHRHLLEWLYYN